VVFLACVHLALFLALSLSPRNSHVSSRLYILLLAVWSLFIYLLIYFFTFNDFCQVTYLKIYWTDLCQIFTVGNGIYLDVNYGSLLMINYYSSLSDL